MADPTSPATAPGPRPKSVAPVPAELAAPPEHALPGADSLGKAAVTTLAQVLASPLDAIAHTTHLSLANEQTITSPNQSHTPPNPPAPTADSQLPIPPHPAAPDSDAAHPNETDPPAATPASATPPQSLPEHHPVRTNSNFDASSASPMPPASAAVDSVTNPDKTVAVCTENETAHYDASPKDVTDAALSEANHQSKPEVANADSDTTTPSSDLKRKLDSPHSDQLPTKKPKHSTESQQTSIPRNTRLPPPSTQRQKRPNQNGSRQSPSKSSANSSAPSERPMPTNLPKSVKHRPENSRVFIGNLASEYTDVNEITRVFHNYGDLIEEPVLRRSFGFVQYSSAEAASRAVAAEQGRIIGGIAIDLSIADNREVKRGTHVANNTPFGQSTPVKPPVPRGRTRGERDFGTQNADKTDRSRKRRRSLSPASLAKKGGVHPPQYRRMRPDPKNGIYLRILCMSPTARAYARHCENTFRSMTGLAADVLHIVAAGLGEALGRAMRDVIPYVMVVASKDVDDGTCTIRTLEKTGYEKSGRGNGVIPLREAVEVCLIERGVIAPQSIAHQIGGPVAAPGGMNRMAPMGNVNHGGRHAQHGMGGHGRQWGGPNSGHMGNPPVETAKPGWMTGPRAPHPSNPRVAPASIAPGIHQTPQGMGSVVGTGGGFGFNGMDGNRGQYNQAPGVGVSPVASHRPDHNYGRGLPPPGAYEPGPPMGQTQNMGPPGQQNMGPPGHQNMGPPGQQGMGGDYMRRPGANGNPSVGMHPPGGYIDRYSAPEGNQRGNGYTGRGDIRESEYDPAAVMPSHRGPNPNYGNSWNRDVAPVNRDMYGGDRPPPPPPPPPPHQPAVARDRNGGFQTIGGGPQVYPGGGGGAAANAYGYDRSQTQGPPAGQYGPMSNASGYDARQNAYPGAQPPAAYGQYGAPQGPGGMPHGADGANRYGGGMYNDPQQAYPGNPVPGVYNSNAPSNNGRGGGWSGGNSSQQHPNAMGMHSTNMGGPNMSAGPGHSQGGHPHGGQMQMHNNSGGQMHIGPGGHPGMSGYGVPNNRGNTNNGYMGRNAGGMGGSNQSQPTGSNNVSTPAANVLGTSAVDIKKLTTLISAFQQKQAAAQAPAQGQMRGGQGGHKSGQRQSHAPYPPQQYQGQQGHQRNGGQQGFYR